MKNEVVDHLGTPITVGCEIKFMKWNAPKQKYQPNPEPTRRWTVTKIGRTGKVHIEGAQDTWGAECVEVQKDSGQEIKFTIEVKDRNDMSLIGSEVKTTRDGYDFTLLVNNQYVTIYYHKTLEAWVFFSEHTGELLEGHVYPTAEAAVTMLKLVGTEDEEEEF